MIDATSFMRILRDSMRPMMRRINGIVSRGTVKTVDDSTADQSVQLSMMNGEVTHPIESLHPYGFSSHPPTGAQAVHLSVGGDRENGVALVVSDVRSRPTGQPAGTVTLHNENAVLVKLTPTGEVELGEAPSDFVALAGRVQVELQQMIAAYNSHTHTSQSGPTSTPVSPSLMSDAGSVAATKVKAV